jgi:hypothetical protein
MGKHAPETQQWAQKFLDENEAGKSTNLLQFLRNNPKCNVKRTTLRDAIKRLRENTPMKQVGRKRTLSQAQEDVC